MCNEHCAMWNHVHHGYKKHLCCWKVGGVDGPPTCENVTTNDSTINMHLEIKNSLENEILQLIVIKVQVVLLKPHHWNSICWDFYVMNDDLHMDFEILQMLWCIIYTLKKSVK